MQLPLNLMGSKKRTKKQIQFFKSAFLFFFLSFPLDCFRDDSGLNALRIKNCLSKASFFNLAGRPEAAR
jgi:hypothetical protein